MFKFKKEKEKNRLDFINNVDFNLIPRIIYFILLYHLLEGK